MAKLYHPDENKSSDAGEKFKEIQWAYEEIRKGPNIHKSFQKENKDFKGKSTDFYTDTDYYTDSYKEKEKAFYQYYQQKKTDENRRKDEWAHSRYMEYQRYKEELTKQKESLNQKISDFRRQKEQLNRDFSFAEGDYSSLVRHYSSFVCEIPRSLETFIGDLEDYVSKKINHNNAHLWNRIFDKSRIKKNKKVEEQVEPMIQELKKMLQMVQNYLHKEEYESALNIGIVENIDTLIRRMNPSDRMIKESKIYKNVELLKKALSSSQEAYPTFSIRLSEAKKKKIGFEQQLHSINASLQLAEKSLKEIREKLYQLDNGFSFENFEHFKGKAM